MVSTRSTRAPISTRCMRSRLLNSSTAQQISTTEVATSAVTIDRRARSPAPLDPRAAVLRAAVADCRDMRSAGRSPTTSDTTRPIAVATASTRQFSDTSAVNGMAGTKGTAIRIITAASATPATAAGRAEHQALGQQLGGNAPARCAERDANRDLLAPRGAPGEKEVGDVRAGNQQHEDHRTERDIDRLAQIVTDQLPIERLDGDAPVFLPRGNRVGDLRSHGEQIGVCLLQRHAALQPRKRIQPVRAGRPFLGRERVQPPEACRVLQWPRPMPVERARGQDADDLVRFVVEEQVAPEDGGVTAEMRLPGRMTQDHDAVRTVPIFLGPERAADDRRNAEHAEVIGRDVTAVEARRLAVDHDRRRRQRLGGHGVERTGQAFQLLEGSSRRLIPGLSRSALPRCARCGPVRGTAAAAATRRQRG